MGFIALVASAEAKSLQHDGNQVKRAILFAAQSLSCNFTKELGVLIFTHPKVQGERKALVASAEAKSPVIDGNQVKRGNLVQPESPINPFASEGPGRPPTSWVL